jgi:signal transduction histidine kinase
MRGFGVNAVTWEDGMEILACLIVAVASLAAGIGLLGASRSQQGEPFARTLRLAASLIIAGALFQAGCGMALWFGAPSLRSGFGGWLALMPAGTALVLLMCWRRYMNPLSARHLRDVNQALRREIEALRAHSAAQSRHQRMEALVLFSSGVSHYVNNIMQVTGGALALLAPRVAGDSSAEDLIAMAQEAAARSAQLTKQLLLFAQQPALSARLVDVSAFVRVLRRDLAVRLGPGIALHLDDWDEEPLVPLLIDMGEMMEMVTHVIANAQEAMGKTGTLTMALATYYARERVDLADGYYLRLTVTDDGTGLSPHLAEQAFDPFVSSKPAGISAGLGLSVVYGLSRKAGGTVTLESTPGEGASATMFLRLAIDEAEQGVTPDRSMDDNLVSGAEDFGGLRVMLVDDEQETRTIVAMTLETLGCVVVQATGGVHALEQMGAQTGAQVGGAAFDLFILDYAMPGMNGAELAAALRARDGACRIVFLTGFADRVAIEATLGPDAALVYKPASRRQLGRAIAEALP